MRLYVIISVIFIYVLAYGKDTNTRLLTLDTQGITTFEATCGSGFLKIYGKPGLKQINVTANIRPEGLNPRKLQKVVTLTLKRAGSRAILTSITKNDAFGLFDWIFGNNEDNIEIDLTIEIPQHMNLKITDGSGGTEIRNIRGNVNIIDGSGFLSVQNIDGALEITDGSGGILVRNINGNCQVHDGSGEITLKQINGDLAITDGSGAMFIDHIGGSVEITDGSGEINLEYIRDTITISDGSGDIKAGHVNGDLILKSTGSGKVITNQVRGHIIGLRK